MKRSASWYSFKYCLVLLISTWLYLVGRGQQWLLLGVTGSEQGGTGCQYDEPSENIWFAWSKPSNHWIFEEGKSDDGQIYRHTEFPLVDSTPSVDGTCDLNIVGERKRMKMTEFQSYLWSLLGLLLLLDQIGSGQRQGRGGSNIKQEKK